MIGKYLTIIASAVFFILSVICFGVSFEYKFEKPGYILLVIGSILHTCGFLIITYGVW